MDIRNLVTFVEVCELKNFSKAAEKLFISQPTVSAHIQILEKEMGAVLFNRLGHTITLTEEGEILYDYAKQIIFALHKAKIDISVSSANVDGNISIFASSVPKSFFLPKEIVLFSKSYPNVSFSVLGLDSLKVIEKVKDGSCDFGIVGFQLYDASLVYHELFSDEICYLVSRKLFKDKNSLSEIDFDDINKYPILLREPSSGTYKTFISAIGNDLSKLNQKKISVFDSNNLILNLVKEGLGGAFISNSLIDSNDPDIVQLRLKNLVINRLFYLVRHKNKLLSPSAESFYKFILKSGLRSDNQ